MLDSVPDFIRPALKLAFEHQAPDRPWAPIMVGGAPHLPDAMEWPRLGDTPLHFLAQIDLASLPRHVAQGDTIYDLPEMPRHGTLFIFMPMHFDLPLEGDAQVLFSPKSARDAPMRMPPNDIPLLDDDAQCIVHVDVTPCGTMLHPLSGRATGFLSHCESNPLRIGLHHEEARREWNTHDRAYNKMLRPFGLTYPTPEPQFTPHTPDSDIPYRFDRYFDDGTFQWSWEYVFEVSKRAAAELYQLPIGCLNDEIEAGYDKRGFRRYINKMRHQRQQIMAQDINGRSTWWERFRFADGSLPSSKLLIDSQFEGWMSFARLNQHRPLGVAHKHAFLDLLRHVVRVRFDDLPVELVALGRLRNHDLDGRDILTAVQSAFETLATDRADLHRLSLPDPELPSGPDRSSAVQLFGFSGWLHHEPTPHQDHVLLMSFGKASGLEFSDAIFQIWVPPNDLALGRFDRMICQLE